ncbi:muconolactone Delta-isomerase family protein [Streptomyces violaceusniger]|uniref:muconolactone Delta-isomerase family protein n=1 Tax=Streptomyces violaceusniger TaxID=68280 RepID=UPI0036CC15A7
MDSARAKELASAGHFVRLWRPAGELRGIGVWRADSEADQPLPTGRADPRRRQGTRPYPRRRRPP